jgi:DNA adenine methylase
MEQLQHAIRLSDFPLWRSKSASSPFRYPGGKGFLTGFLSSEVEKLSIGERHYVEAFAGGAGAAINMLQAGLVQKVHLNDIDLRVYSAWVALTQENDRFVEAIRCMPVDVETWRKAKANVDNPGVEYSFELGLATFFVNRTSRAGIVVGSGPIGGYEQAGAWKIDARFYRETMLRRIRWIGENSDRITVSRKPAVDFLKNCSETTPDERTLYFIDPPYVQIGSRLYYDGMVDGGHEDLANFMKKGSLKHWVMTYDDHVEVRRLYREFKIRSLEVSYSLGRTRKENEVVISN